MDYDVVIIGAGPIGLSEACFLKSLNNKLRICVLEGRETPTRDYGISIGWDAVTAIIDVVNRAFGNLNENRDIPSLGFIKNCFRDWGYYSSVRTNQIQTELSKKATELGVTILKGEKYKVTTDNLSQIFDPLAAADLLSPELQALRTSLCNAKVIVDAAGAHSPVRQKVMGSDKDNLTDVETYAYGLEVKHEIATDSKRRPNFFHIKGYASEAGHIVNQSIGKPKEGTNLLPVTDLLIVDEKIHTNFIKKNEKDEVIRGAPGKAWSLSELEEEAKTNPVLANYSEKIKEQIHKTKMQCEADMYAKTKAPEIATIPLRVYRSKQIVNIFQDKVVISIGDSSSGLILRRGFTKGLKEAALVAELIVNVFDKIIPEALRSDGIPEEFLQYQQKAKEMYANEKWWIAQKARAINFVSLPLRYMISPIYRFITRTLGQLVSLAIYHVTSRFKKQGAAPAA